MNLNNPPPAVAQTYPPTVQTDLSGSRTLGSIYHNTLTKPRRVQVAVTLAQSAGVVCYSDTTATPTVLVAVVDNLNLLSISQTLSVTILSGNYYSFAASAGVTLIGWIELD